MLEKGGEGLSEKEKRDLQEKVRWMPGRIDEARERETQEVVGKLKDVSFSLLTPELGANVLGINSSVMDC